MNVNLDGAATNGAGTTNGATPANDNGAGRARSPFDAMVDDAMSFLADDKPADKQAPTEEGPPQKPRPETEEPDEREDEGEGQAPAEEGEPEGDEEAGHDTRGSKEDPFNVKDLPEDKFIAIKVDGEKEVVSLAELAAGYTREKTFHQRINKTKALADEAQAALQSAKQTQEQLRTEFQGFIRDPEQIYEFFLASDEREKVLEQVAIRYAELRRRHREVPEERLAFQRQRDQARLMREREVWEEQKRAEVEARQQAELRQRAERVFRPGWEAGLKRAGFPKQTQELWDEVIVRANQKAARGEPVTTDDIADFVVRAAKVLDLPPANGKPAARSAPGPRREPERPRRRGKDWDAVPARERVKDPDWFLKNLKARDFRL